MTRTISTATAWAVSIGTKVTLRMDGTFVQTGTAIEVDVDVLHETFASSHAVDRAIGTANLRRTGNLISARRLADALATTPLHGAFVGTLADLLEHDTFGAVAPSFADVLAANEWTVDAEAAA